MCINAKRDAVTAMAAAGPNLSSREYRNRLKKASSQIAAKLLAKTANAVMLTTAAGPNNRDIAKTEQPIAITNPCLTALGARLTGFSRLKRGSPAAPAAAVKARA